MEDDNFFESMDFGKTGSPPNKQSAKAKTIQSESDEFESWYKSLKPSPLSVQPSKFQLDNPCKTDFFKNYRNKNEPLSLSLQTFYFLYSQLRDDQKVQTQTKEYFADFEKTIEKQLSNFNKELESVNTNRELAQLSSINLNRFREGRKLINRADNQNAQFNFEVSSFYKTKVEEDFMKKTKEGFDSSQFSKKQVGK